MASPTSKMLQSVRSGSGNSGKLQTCTAPEHPTLLILGPTPPPYHGVSVAMQTVYRSDIMKRFNVILLDTADRRDISHVENPDIYDVVLFVQQFFKNICLLVRHRPGLFYIPICQTRVGFIRDAFFMIPAFLANCRVVVHLHGGAAFSNLFLQGGTLWRGLMNFVLRRVSRFIVLGEVHRPIFTPWARPECISVVPNGIEESSPADPDYSPSAARDRTRFRVVYLSTLCRGKGLFLLLEAMSLIVREHSDTECVIAGQWWGRTTKAEAEELICKLGIQNHVSFVGPMTGPEKSEFLRSGDVFVFPSIYPLEGQPLVILEAMREGLPVVASDIGCMAETVEQGVTGFIVPQNDLQAVCDKVLTLIRNPTLRASMGKCSQARFEQHYTSHIFANRLEQALLETVTS